MGPIQSSVNQSITMAGVAKQIYQQSPQYQEKQSKKKYEEGSAALKETKKGAGSEVREELMSQQIKLQRERAADLKRSGKYGEWAQMERKAAYSQSAMEKGFFGKKPNMYSPYDEEKSNIANDRAENIAQQVKKQQGLSRDAWNQLKGVNQTAQAYLISKGFKEEEDK